MISQEVDRLLTRGWRGSFLVAIFTSPLNWMVTLGTFTLVCLSLAMLLWSVAFLIFAVSIGSALWLKYREFERHKYAHFWKFLKFHWMSGGRPTRRTQQLIDTMIEIHGTKRGTGLLPLRPAVELVVVYEHQQQKLERVEKRLSALETLRSELRGRLKQLQRQGENHDKGVETLRRAEEDCATSEKTQGQLQASCARLEIIAMSAQQTAQSYRLRQELDELSSRVSRPAEVVEPAFEPESLEDIERQIGREIETYLQLERETEEHLR